MYTGYQWDLSVALKDLQKLEEVILNLTNNREKIIVELKELELLNKTDATECKRICLEKLLNHVDKELKNEHFRKKVCLCYIKNTEVNEKRAEYKKEHILKKNKKPSI